MKNNKRIPVFLPPPPKTEIDGKITHLSSKSKLELLELRDRQSKLLNNKSFISKLPDKGAKIKAFHNKIVDELQVKQEEEQTCLLFNRLNLNAVDKQSIQNVEWEGKIQNKENANLDSDDDSDSENVLQILSKSTNQEKKIKVLQPVESLITPEDLVNIGEVPHINYIVNKTENNPEPKPQTGQFKPYKTTKSNVHNPEKEILRKKHINWEITAATPPPIMHGPAKLLTLEESLKLQKKHNIHLKNVEAQHAAERLLASSGIKMDDFPIDTSKFGKYREVDSDDSNVSDMEGSEHEVLDEEPERGGVIFTVMK